MPERATVSSRSEKSAEAVACGKFPSLVAQQRQSPQHRPHDQMGRPTWNAQTRINLNLSNRSVRTRVPGGVAGVRSHRSPPMPICVKARYSKHFEISEEAVSWLAEKTSLLLELVKVVCSEHLARLTGNLGIAAWPAIPKFQFQRCASYPRAGSGHLDLDKQAVIQPGFLELPLQLLFHHCADDHRAKASFG